MKFPCGIFRSCKIGECVEKLRKLTKDTEAHAARRYTSPFDLATVERFGIGDVWLNESPITSHAVTRASVFMAMRPFDLLVDGEAFEKALALPPPILIEDAAESRLFEPHSKLEPNMDLITRRRITPPAATIMTHFRMESPGSAVGPSDLNLTCWVVP